MSEALFSVGGVDVDHKTLLLAGTGGGLMFILTCVVFAMFLRRRGKRTEQPSRKDGSGAIYNGVKKQDSDIEKGSMDSEDDIILTEDEYFDEGAHTEPQITATGTVNQRTLDLSAFANANYRGAFDLDHCLQFIQENLESWKLKDTARTSRSDLPELDVEEFAAELEARWRLIDEDCIGAVSRDDLRLAVWNNDADYDGLALPEGDLPESLQAIVDDILTGVGMDDNDDESFSFWQFANYLLKDADGIDYGVVIPRPNQSWAIATSL